MLVICYGMQKSGSTLAFEMVSGVLQSAGFAQDFVHNDLRGPAEAGERSHRNSIGTITKDKIATLIETIGVERKIAVKTHATFPSEMFAWLEYLQGKREIQVITSYRDPRDICLSLLDAGRKSRIANAGAFGDFRTLDDTADFVQNCVSRFRKWSALHGTLRMNYEIVAFTPEVAIDAIERVLGVTSNHQRVLKHTFEDSYTQKNKAQTHRHLEDMTDHQREQMTELFHRFMTNACESDKQSWYDKCRDRILAGADVED